MAKKKTVTIRKDDVEAEVLPSSVGLWVRKGWKVYEKDAKEVGFTKGGADKPTDLLPLENGTSDTTDKKE